MTLLKNLFPTVSAAPQATDAKQPPAPRLLDAADIAAVAGGPVIVNDGA